MRYSFYILLLLLLLLLYLGKPHRKTIYFSITYRKIYILKYDDNHDIIIYSVLYLTYIYIFDLLDCSLTMGHKEHYINVEIDTNLFRVCPTCWGSGISKKAPPDDDCYELTMNKTNYIKLKYPVPSQVSSFISTKKQY